MIELELKKHLEDKTKLDVFLMLPTNKPKKFISFERIGGNYDNMLKSSTFAIQSWGESLFDVATLNEEIKDYLNEFTENEKVSKVKINSDYNFTDTRTKKYRYQIVAEIWHY